MRRVVEMQNTLFANAIAAALLNFYSDMKYFESGAAQDMTYTLILYILLPAGCEKHQERNISSRRVADEKKQPQRQIFAVFAV